MKKSYFYALVSVFFWSTTTTVSKLLLRSITTLQMMAIVFTLAMLFLFFLNLKKEA